MRNIATGDLDKETLLGYKDNNHDLHFGGTVGAQHCAKCFYDPSQFPTELSDPSGVIHFMSQMK